MDWGKITSMDLEYSSDCHVFVPQFGSLVLEELFCEGNNFVRAELKQSVQEVEVLSLNVSFEWP